MPPPELRAVAEAPWHAEGAPPWPWAVADLPAFSWIELSGETIELEVGSVAAARVSSGRIEGEGVEVLLGTLVAEDGFGVRGGIRASDDTREIAPSCCSGLKDWRQWLDGLATGQSPWLGHDPSAHVEYGPEVVRVWSDGGLAAALGAAEGAFAIDFERGHFERELARVAADLLAFLGQVKAWARSVGFSDPPALARAFDRDFHVRSAPPVAP